MRDQRQAFSVPAFTPFLHPLQNPKYFEIWQYLGITTGASLFHLGWQSADSDWDYPDTDQEYEASPQQHPLLEISGPPVWSPAAWLAPTGEGMLPGAPPDPWGLSPSPDPRPRQAQPRPQRGSARRVPRTSQRLPCRRRFLPLVLPPSGGKTTQPLVPQGFLHPEGGRGGAPRRGQEEAGALRQPRRARGSRRCPPRVRLCPAAAPAPAPAPQGGSSSSPARGGEGKTSCCFLSAAHVPQLAKHRLVKFHTNAPAWHSVPRLQPPPRTPGHPGLQEGGSSGETEPREEPQPPLREVGGKAPRGAGSPSAARAPCRGSQPRCFALRRAIALPSHTTLRLARCQLGRRDSPPGRVSRLLPAAIHPRGEAHARDRWGRGRWSGLRRWVGQRRQGGHSQGASGAPKSAPGKGRWSRGARRRLAPSVPAEPLEKAGKRPGRELTPAPPFRGSWGAVPSLGAFLGPWHLPGLHPSPSESRSCLVA